MNRKCGACGAGTMTPFTNETFTIEHGDAVAAVDGLAGWQCAACSEVELDDASARRFEAADDRLVAMRAAD